MESLPTTDITLIGFIVASFIGSIGWLIRAHQKQINEFMEYIQKKNGINEKLANTFSESSKEQQQNFSKMLKEQGERHAEAMKIGLENVIRECNK